ncbi:MAG: uracil-DNA glycosylase [Parachlamydiaceae bacterium]|nr:uracil-DNA glycosylase [Parachlamydiaceae bacterium]
MPFFDPIWSEILADELAKPYFQELLAFVERERLLGNVYPKEADLFNAFFKTSFLSIKVVFVGQDPYHGPNQATGLIFSIPKGMPFPPSLRNIFRELHEDLGIPIPTHGSLEHWASQGVLLLNSILTVREGMPLSHANKGWEKFTDAVLRKLAMRDKPPIFVLWGNSAQKKCLPLIGFDHLLFLKSVHPSPLSAHRGFFGSRPFSKLNAMLQQQGNAPIDWAL